MSFFGNLFKSEEPDLPKPPDLTQYLNYIDELSGVQTKVVTDANGNKTLVTSRAPRSPEDEATYLQARDLLTNSLKNIAFLTELNPESANIFSPFTDAFRTEYQREVDQIFRGINSNANTQLAQRGLGNSSYGSDVNARIAGQYSNASQKGYTDSILLGEQLRNQELARQASAFGIASQQEQLYNPANKTQNAVGNAQILPNMVNKNYQNQNQYELDKFNNRKPGLGEVIAGSALQLGGAALGNYFGGPGAGATSGKNVGSPSSYGPAGKSAPGVDQGTTTRKPRLFG